MDFLEVSYKNDYSSLAIGNFLSKLLTANSAIVCIGTDRCIVDSLGPLVGTMLSKENFHLDVYGTLGNPVHAKNLVEIVEEIKKRNYDQILAIDACLSNNLEIGMIKVQQKPICPGKGIGKVLPTVGDISIIGIADISNKSFDDLSKDVRLALIYEMAETISNGLIVANYMLQSSRTLVNKIV